MEYPALGERIKKRRMECGMTQGDIAAQVGVAISTIQRYEKGQIGKIKLPVVEAIARALRVSPEWLIGKSDDPSPLPLNAIPFQEIHFALIVGAIPAGYPALALEDIEGYASIPYADSDNYFFLRVKGESMVGAGILPGDLVLIRRQTCADNGQIVAARVNGDEATLKRFKQQGDTVLLLPENPSYEPRIVSVKEFEMGDAQIIGVAIEVRHPL